MSFNINANGILDVTAEDIRTGNTGSVTITNTRGIQSTLGSGLWHTYIQRYFAFQLKLEGSVSFFIPHTRKSTPGRLTESEIKRMVKDADKLKTEDQRRIQVI